MSGWIDLSDIEEEKTDVRLAALEYLIDALWGHALAELPVEKSADLLDKLKRGTEQWEVSADAGPQDVARIQRFHEILKKWMELRIDRIVEREASLRSSRH